MKYIMVILLVFGVLSEARAQSADIYLRKGARYARYGNFERALKYFEKAIKIEPDNPAAYYNAGSVAASVGNCKKVLLYMKGFLFLAEDMGLGGDSVKKAESKYKKCSRIKEIGKITITTPKPGLKVFIDGSIIGRTPINELPLVEGSYTIEIRDPNFEPLMQEFNVEKGESNTLTLYPKAKIFYGYLNVSTDPVAKGVEVYVDGKFIGKTPLEKYRLTTGKHLVLLKMKGFDPWKRYVEIKKEDTTYVEATLYRPYETVKGHKALQNIPPQYFKIWKELETK